MLYCCTHMATVCVKGLRSNCPIDRWKSLSLKGFILQELDLDYLLLCNCPGFMLLHCVQKKNTHSHFLSYLHELFVDLNKNCSEYTQGLIDSDNVKIRYSLRSMTSLWRHICLAKVGASLQHAISRDPKDIIFASTWYLLVHRRGRIMNYVVEFKTIILTVTNFHSETWLSSITTDAR